MGSFSGWVARRLALESKGGARPVQMPKGDSNKISVDAPKDRIPGGRRETGMDSRPKRLRTRGSKNRDAIQGFQEQGCDQLPST